MARFAEKDITRIKQDIAVQRLAEASDIKLTQHGADLIGLCPFHDDKAPSLVISPKKNLWHCLGACQIGGSVIDWVMKMEGVSFRHAVELLRENNPPLAASSELPPIVKRATVKKLPTPLSTEAEDQTLLNQVVAFYHTALKQNTEALDYLTSRGLASSEMIDHFKLGVANRTLGYRLPEKNRKEGAALRGRLQRLGLMRASGHEHFNGSIVIPIRDEHGNVLEVYGRKLRNNLRKGTPLHLYLPGPHQGVFNVDALKTHQEIILCESLIDALTFWCAGYRNVTCSYGVEGFTNDHLAAFKQTNTQRVLIAYDRDAAGDQAAQTLAAQLMQVGIDCYRIQFPKGMDANDYAVNVAPASKSLGLVIRKALWLGNGKAPSLPTTGIVLSNDAPVPVVTNEIKNEATKEENKTEKPVNQEEETPFLVADPVESDPLPATPLPESPHNDIDANVTDQEITITLGKRRYRVRGLTKNLSYDQLKVNVLVSCDDMLHVDTLDLYAAKPRASFIKQAAVELSVNEDVIKKELGQVLLKLEALQEQHIKQTLAPKEKTITLDDDEKQQALALLKDPDLLQRILTDFDRCGVVGEQTNKLVGYLAAVSRHLDSPLAIIIQSTSAAGKSALMDAVLAFVPEEHRVQYSAMTGQSLFYMGEHDLKHKILAIAEEEGVTQAAYALKLLQSEGELTIASTGKDPDTGKLITNEYSVEGPVMLFLTTTAIDIDEELMNRCIVLTVDESREQTQAIHRLQRQRRTLSGLLAKKDKDSILTLHRNAQRLLKPLSVSNPYADHLTFLDDRTRTRRDHEKYLSLIESIALLHQYQRTIQHTQHNGQSLSYIEVTLDDITLANQLAHDVLGRSLDELPPQTRRLLMLIETMVITICKNADLQRSDTRFSRKTLRDDIGWGDTQLKIHLQRLVEMEYLLIHRGGRGQSFDYELLYDGQGKNGQPFLTSLIDVTQLKEKKNDYDARRSGQTTPRSGSSRPVVEGQLGGGRTQEKQVSPLYGSVYDDSDPESEENAHIGNKNKRASYVPAHLLPLAANAKAGH